MALTVWYDQSMYAAPAMPKLQKITTRILQDVMLPTPDQHPLVVH